MDSQQTLILTHEPFQKLLLVSAHLDARVGSVWGLTSHLKVEPQEIFMDFFFSASMFPSPNHRLYPYLQVS